MIIAILVLFGLCIGSFVNAFVWRLHSQPKAKSLKLKASELSIIKGRSMCVHCHHTLAWYDLLPVVSWLSLAGRCRYCQKSISGQYPLVEILTAALFVISYVFFPIFHIPYSIFLFALWLIFLTAFMALAVYDLKWMVLPDKLTYPLSLLAVFYMAVQAIAAEDFEVVIAAFISVMVLAGFFWLLFQVSDGKWIGGGDVKLAVPIALILGRPELALLALFAASLLGSLAAIPLMLAGKAKRNAQIPFGPFLIAAAIFTYLSGPALISWYAAHFIFL